MIELGVIFGSRAAEHDVSIISGLQVLENADKSKYNAFPIYVSRRGEWFIGEPLRDIKTYRSFSPDMKGLTRVFLPPVPGVNGLYPISGGGVFAKKEPVKRLDCAIFAFHGMNGEDGTMQGLFELANIPYSSTGIVGSAAGMDKVIMKEIFKAMGLPVLESEHFFRSDYESDRAAVIAKAEKIGYPLYVKPANLGSSIGISRVDGPDDIARAIELALSFDRHVLIEKGVDAPKEVNCACLGFEDDVMPSLCEEPVNADAFLTFEDKYTRGSGSKGMKSLSRRIPAPIGDELTECIQGYTAEIFRMFECKGVVRVDYLLEPKTGKVYVNEINTIPGSFAFYLYEPMGLSFGQLVDKLVEYAYKALTQKNESTFAYDSEILTKAFGGTKITKK